MPRYLVMTEIGPGVDLPVVLDGVGDRFPEVDLELVAEALVCRAPSETHIRRYMDAAGVGVRAISRA